MAKAGFSVADYLSSIARAENTTGALSPHVENALTYTAMQFQQAGYQTQTLRGEAHNPLYPGGVHYTMAILAARDLTRITQEILQVMHIDAVPAGALERWNHGGRFLEPLAVHSIRSGKTDWLVGRGILDMRGSIAASILHARNPESTGAMLITSDEEHPMEAARMAANYLLQENQIPAGILGLEPVGDKQVGDRLKTARRGDMVAHVHIPHSGNPTPLIEALSRLELRSALKRQADSPQVPGYWMEIINTLAPQHGGQDVTNQLPESANVRIAVETRNSGHVLNFLQTRQGGIYDFSFRIESPSAWIDDRECKILSLQAKAKGGHSGRANEKDKGSAFWPILEALSTLHGNHSGSIRVLDLSCGKDGSVRAPGGEENGLHLTLDIRISRDYSPSDIKQMVATIFQDCHAEIGYSYICDGYAAPQDNPLAEAAIAQARNSLRHLGIEPEFDNGAGGVAETNILHALFAKAGHTVPIVELGLPKNAGIAAGFGGMHAPLEACRRRDIHHLARIIGGIHQCYKTR